MRKKYKTEIEADELASSMSSIISSDSHRKNFGLNQTSISKQASIKEPQVIKIAKCSAKDCECGSKCSCGDKCEGKECKACKKCMENVKSAFTQICQSLLSHADVLDQLNLTKSATDLLKVTSNLLKEAACEMMDENNASAKDLLDLEGQFEDLGDHLEDPESEKKLPIPHRSQTEQDEDFEDILYDSKTEYPKDSANEYKMDDPDLDELLSQLDETDVNNVSDTGKALGLTDEEEKEISGIKEIDLEELGIDDSESAKALKLVFEKHPEVRRRFLESTNTSDLPKNFPRSPKSPGRLDKEFNYNDLSLPELNDEEFELPDKDLNTDIDELGNDNDFLGEADTEFPPTQKSASKEAKLFAQIKKWAETDDDVDESTSDEDKLEKMFNKYKEEYDADDFDVCEAFYQWGRISNSSKANAASVYATDVKEFKPSTIFSERSLSDVAKMILEDLKENDEDLESDDELSDDELNLGEDVPDENDNMTDEESSYSPNRWASLKQNNSNKIASLKKKSTIKKLPNGKFKLVSYKGKNLGIFDSHKDAAKHEGEVEYFKNKKSDLFSQIKKWAEEDEDFDELDPATELEMEETIGDLDDEETMDEEISINKNIENSSSPFDKEIARMQQYVDQNKESGWISEKSKLIVGEDYLNKLKKDKLEWQAKSPKERQKYFDEVKEEKNKNKLDKKRKKGLSEEERLNEADLDKEVVDALREFHGQKPLEQQRIHEEPKEDEDDESAFIQNLENQFG